MTWLSLLRSPRVVLGTVIVALLAAGVWAIVAAYDAQFERGRQYERNRAHFNTTFREMIGAKHDTAIARTDTLVKVVTKRVREVDTLIRTVHDTVRVRFPAVDSALTACSALARDCSEFRARALEEREAARVRIVNDSALIHGLAVSRVALRDTLAQLAKRPTRKAQFVTAIISLSVGALACKAARC